MSTGTWVVIGVGLLVYGYIMARVVSRAIVRSMDERKEKKNG